MLKCQGKEQLERLEGTLREGRWEWNKIKSKGNEERRGKGNRPPSLAMGKGVPVAKLIWGARFMWLALCAKIASYLTTFF